MIARGSFLGGEYEVWGRLDEGGMSEVWLAKHAVLCVPVIIKTLRQAVAEATGDGASKRMFNEARLMARVTDPRVVRAIDAGVAGGQPYLVQEYVDGLDLAELDRERRAAFGVGLPLWFVCEVMADACRARHSAHQAGVLHRDVKPSNLFMAPETGVRLGDFGIAVAREDGGSHDVCGTIKFMAPEQLRGEPLDRTTDVYGAGATAFDLRYGHAPYTRIGDVLDTAKTAAFPAAGSPPEAYFQHLLAGMLAKDRAARAPDLAGPAQHFALLARALRPNSPATALVALAKNRFRLGDCELALSVGDIADQEAPAIVSSAQYEMTMRVGSSDALRRRGGDAIEAEAMKDGPRALGACVVTGAGTLAARQVIHAVSAWNETSCIGRAMYRALLKADQLGLRSIAAPALGTGSGRVTMQTCANAMMSALRWHLAVGGSRIQRVTVVLESEAKLALYRDVAEEALRGYEAAPHHDDLGIPVEDGAARADAPTFYGVTRVSTR